MSVIRCVYGRSTATPSVIRSPSTHTTCLQARPYTKRWQRKSSVSVSLSSTCWPWIAAVVAFQQWSPTCFINDNPPIAMTSPGKLNMVYIGNMYGCVFNFHWFLCYRWWFMQWDLYPATCAIHGRYGFWSYSMGKCIFLSLWLAFLIWTCRWFSRNVKSFYLPSRHMLLIETNTRFYLTPATTILSRRKIYACIYPRALRRSKISNIWYVKPKGRLMKDWWLTLPFFKEPFVCNTNH